MDCNGLLWISRNQVNGFEDASMDCYGMFKKRGPDTQEPQLKKPSNFKGFGHYKMRVYPIFTPLFPNMVHDSA